MRLYQAIARKLQAIRNCEASGNTEWRDQHTEQMLCWIRDHMPSGSGFDCGTHISLPASGLNRLVFDTAFHHMDTNGYYNGWTYHRVVVTPDLCFGYAVKVTGPNRNNIKEYIAETFNSAGLEDVDCF